MLVGRRRELDLLTGLAVQGSSVLMRGDPGIGKTRLALEGVTRLRERGRLAVMAACLPVACQLPLLPIVDALRDIYQHDGGATAAAVLDSCPGFVRQDLARLLPEIDAAAPTESGPWQQQRLFMAVVTFLQGVQASSGITMVIDDVHWSDPTTRDFLTYLVAHLPGSGLSVILTSRSELTPGMDVEMWLQRLSLSPLVTTVELAALSVEDVSLLAELITGAEVPPYLTENLHQRTAGNALFVEQLLASGPYTEATVPSEELVRLIESRLAVVDSVSRRVLVILSVAGRPVFEQELVELTALDGGTVRECLATLFAAKFLRLVDSDGIVVRHPLLGEVLVNALLPGEKAEVHGLAAATLTKRADPRLAAEIAGHWSSASRPMEELEARINAAEYAEAVCAFAQAADHWERAITVAEHVQPETVGRLALRGMIAWEHAGQESRGTAIGHRGLRHLADHPHPGLQAGLRARLAMLQFGDNKARSVSELTEAVEAFATLPPSTDEVHALVRLYNMYRALGRSQEGRRFVERAVEVGADLTNATGDFIHALTDLAYEHALAGDLGKASSTLSRARAVVEHHPDPSAFTWLAVAESSARLAGNHLEDVVAVGSSDLDRIKSSGFGATFAAGLLTANLAEALLALGRINAAGVLIDSVTNDQAARIDTRAVHLIRCAVDVARGELAAAEDRIQDVLSIASEPGLQVVEELTRVRAELALWKGAPAQAIGLVLHALPRFVATDQEGRAAGLLALGMRACAELSTDAGHDEVAQQEPTALERNLSSVLSLFRSNPFANHLFFPSAPAEAALFRAEQSRFRLLADPPSWRSAAEQWEELGHRHRAAYARWRQAEALLLTGHRPEAAAALTSAWTHADQHEPLRTQIVSLARMARIQLARPDKPPALHPEATPPFNLTDRELDVLRLLVDGRTNAEIGTLLYMSPKTASVHVSAILRKLQASNRVHAAAIAQRLHLTGD